MASNDPHAPVKTGGNSDSGLPSGNRKLTQNAILSATPAFYRISDVLRITAPSRPTLYRRIAAGRFPPPVHLGGRACGWSAAALQAWIDDHEGYRLPGVASAKPGAPLTEDTQRKPGRPRKYPPGA